MRDNEVALAMFISHSDFDVFLTPVGGTIATDDSGGGLRQPGKAGH
jgi:hypothetical protein